MRTLAFLFFLIFTNLYSAEIVIRPQTLTTEVAGSAFFTVEIRMTGSEMLTDLKIHSDNSLQISNPSVSMSTIIVNGNKKNIHMYGYSVYPLSGGNYEITLEAVLSNGKTESALTKSLSVSVKGDSVMLYSRGTDSSGIPLLTAINPVKMAMSVSDRYPYVNEQIVAELSIFSKFKLLKYPDFIYYPSFNGFWAEIADSLFQSSELSTDFGKVYKYSLKWIVFPLQAGPATVSGAGVEITFSSYPLLPKILNIYSDSLVLNVKPLPLEGVPPTFRGSVGKFFVSLRAPENVDSTAEISVIISGTGNIKGIEDIQPPQAEGADLYYASSEIEITSMSPYIEGKKTTKWTLVPTNSTPIIIQPVQFSYFDPSLGSYVTSETPPCTLSASGDLTPIDTCYKRDTIPPGADIRELNIPELPRSVVISSFALSVSIFAFGAAIFFSRRKIFLSKTNRKKKTFKKLLEQARKHSMGGDYEKSFLFLKKSLVSFFSDENLESFREMSDFASKRLKTEYFRNLFSNLEEIDFTGKTPNESIASDIKTIEKLFEKLENIAKTSIDDDSSHGAE
ncbi:BatD family protein [candidate division WOR-3 bacterium]|nr:BatD family protein [candidate division WOR-3 bacterium]